MPHVMSNGSINLNKFIIDFCLWKGFVSYENAIIILPLPFSPPPLTSEIYNFQICIYLCSLKQKEVNVIKNE